MNTNFLLDNYLTAHSETVELTLKYKNKFIYLSKHTDLENAQAKCHKRAVLHSHVIRI